MILLSHLNWVQKETMWSLILYVVCSMYVVFCKIDHCIHIHWCIVMGLGHNDPWVESHMWPQQTWGQRSSRGQWPLVQGFGKKGQCIHILWCIFKSNITTIAKVCDRESRRDTWFENRLVFLTDLLIIKYFFIIALSREGRICSICNTLHVRLCCFMVFVLEPCGARFLTHRPPYWLVIFCPYRDQSGEKNYNLDPGPTRLYSAQTGLNLNNILSTWK